MKTPSTRTGETTSIPPDILREIESFEEEAAKVLRGELAQDLFRPFRLQPGIYAHRQPGGQMVRIKIPCGALPPRSSGSSPRGRTARPLPSPTSRPASNSISHQPPS